MEKEFNSVPSGWGWLRFRAWAPLGRGVAEASRELSGHARLQEVVS